MTFDPATLRPRATDAEFAPGSKPAEHPFAVMYQGEYETPWDGTATAVRLHARALQKTGIPVFLKSFSGIVIDEFGGAESVHVGGLPQAVRLEIGDLDRTTASALLPVVKHLVVRDAEHLKKVIFPRGAIARGGVEADIVMRKHIYDSTIIYSVWERDRVDPGIARHLSRVAECWVPCHDNREMLIRSGVPEEKVWVIPHPFDEEDPILKLRRRKPTTARRFYSIGRWEPRKGYAELIAAFVSAFQATDDVTLTIKYTATNWPDYPSPEAAVLRALDLPAAAKHGWTLGAFKSKVNLIEGRLPRAAIQKLHYQSNIYVCSSHGEAWCLPAFEAWLAGNRLVYVPDGGVRDFAPPEAVRVVLQGRCPVPRSYQWEADAQWAHFTHEHLTLALTQASAPSDYARQLSPELFTMKVVGELMRDRILEVARRQNPETFSYYEQRTQA